MLRSSLFIMKSMNWIWPKLRCALQLQKNNANIMIRRVVSRFQRNDLCFVFFFIFISPCFGCSLCANSNRLYFLVDINSIRFHCVENWMPFYGCNWPIELFFFSRNWGEVFWKWIDRIVVSVQLMAGYGKKIIWWVLIRRGECSLRYLIFK